jgi:hypothetical protein
MEGEVMSTSSLSERDFAGRTPAYRLFDSNAVAIATLFGSPVMGSSLMAWNYSRLGKTGKAILTVLLATVVTGLVVLIGWNLKPGATSVMGLVMLIGMQRIALYLQGPAVAAHVQRGGALGSKWIAFWLGIAFLVLVFLVVFVYVTVKTNHSSVVIGTKDHVYYTDGATKEDALALGKALQDDGYLTDRGVDVMLAKGKDGTVISFLVQDGVWDEPDSVASFEELGRQLAPVVGGFPIKVQLMNTTHDAKKEMTVGKVEFPGQDAVYYEGSVTLAQAQAGGNDLKAANLFEGNGAVVFVRKDGVKETISFVTGAKLWSTPTPDPDIVGALEKATQKVAPDLGGFPIRMQLLDTKLVVKKDEVITAAN